VYEPVTFNPAEPDPAIVVLLHGLMGSGGMDRWFTRMHRVADTAGFLLALPQARGRIWKDGRSPRVKPVKIHRELDYLQAVIDSCKGKFNIASASLYMVGVSDGGFMAQRFAAERGGMLEGAAFPISNLPDAFDSISPPLIPKIAYMLGTKDPILPYDGGKIILNISGPVKSAKASLAFWGKASSEAVATSTALSERLSSPRCPVRIRECSATEYLHRLYIIENGGHQYPGGRWLPFCGKRSRVINASSELWRFLRYEPVENAGQFAR
jgi:polyhydroxybutyrate depolymerase